MTHDEAKAILQACRGDAAEADDPRVVEALEMVQEYPELADWRKNEMNFDQAFAKSITGIQPPPGLREKILSTMAEASQTPIPFPAAGRKWWQNPKFISMAASIILIFTFGVLLTDPQNLMADPDIPDFCSEVAHASRTFPTMETHSDDLDHIRLFLSQKGAPRPGLMLPNVDPLEEMGALTTDWEGEPVSIVCMKGECYYQLFVISLSVFGDDDIPPATPKVEQHDDIALLFWADSDHLYVLSRPGSVNDLASML